MERLQADLDETMARYVPRIGLTHEEKVKLLSPELERIHGDIRSMTPVDEVRKKSSLLRGLHSDSPRKSSSPSPPPEDIIKSRISETSERIAAVAAEAVQLQKVSEQLWRDLLNELEPKVQALKNLASSVSLNKPSKILTAEEADVIITNIREEYNFERNMVLKLEAIASSVQTADTPKEEMLATLDNWMNVVNELMREPNILAAGVQRSQYWISIRVDLNYDDTV